MRSWEGWRSYQLVISDDPSHFLSWANLGLIYIKKENFTEAVNSFGNAIQQNPDYLQAYFGMAEALIGAGRIREAESLLNRQLEIHPDHPGFLYWFEEVEKVKVYG